MEPKMNFYYPGEGSGEVVVPGEGPTHPSGPSFPKPKTRKEYFLGRFFSKLNANFGNFLIRTLNDKDKTDDLRFAWLVRKFVSPRPFEFSKKANIYVLPIEPFKLADGYGIDIKSIADFENNHNLIMDDKYYEVIIDNTYSCEFSPTQKKQCPCGPYEIMPEDEQTLYITSETEPTHIPVVDVYIHYVIYKQPKSTLEYYIAKAAGYPLLNTDNPPEPKTAEEIYWAYVCKESGGSGSGEVEPGGEDSDGNS